MAGTFVTRNNIRVDGRIARHVFVPETGESKAFVSGYSNALVPNLWVRGTA